MSHFTNPNDPENVQLKITLSNWVCEYYKTHYPDTEPFDAIDIVEYNCPDPGCLHAESLIEIRVGVVYHFFRIAKPLVYIRKGDISSMKETQWGMPNHKH